MTKDAATKLYVVIGTKGEYSERYEWVAGVFFDKATAITLAEGKLLEAKAADVVWDAYCRCRRAVAKNRTRSPELDELIIQQCGVKPDLSEADDFTVVETEPNTWGHWDQI